jgi:hypothetical protein
VLEHPGVEFDDAFGTDDLLAVAEVELDVVGVVLGKPGEIARVEGGDVGAKSSSVMSAAFEWSQWSRCPWLGFPRTGPRARSGQQEIYIGSRCITK